MAKKIRATMNSLWKKESISKLISPVPHERIKPTIYICGQRKCDSDGQIQCQPRTTILYGDPRFEEKKAGKPTLPFPCLIRKLCRRAEILGYTNDVLRKAQNASYAELLKPAPPRNMERSKRALGRLHRLNNNSK